MTNIQLIKSFMQGATSGHTPYRNIYGVGRGTTLSIEGDKLINYTTIIAMRGGNTIKLNTYKYSRTTSEIQNQTRREALSNGLVVIETGEF